MEAMPALAALIAGASGSLHCALMCGPLACAGSGGQRRSAALWHLGRFGAYAALGALLGATGAGAVSTFAASARPVLPWVMAAGLVFAALDLGRHLAPLPGISRLSGALLRVGAKFSPGLRAAAMGAATPLLPCGLVYGMSVAALAAGSAGGGSAVMGAFALGGLPALAATQLHLRFWPRDGRLLRFLRPAVAVLAAAVLVYRAVYVGEAQDHACH